MSLKLIQDTEEGLNPNAQRAGNNHQPDSTRQMAYVPAGTGRSYKSPFDQITFLLTGEQTGGAFFLAAMTVPPGSGVPPHIHHREEETFYLQQGTLTIQVGSESLSASAGDLVLLPRDVVHSFRNPGNVDAKFLLLCSPAGLEKFFASVFDPAANWPGARPPMNDAFKARLLTAAATFGVEFPPPA